MEDLADEDDGLGFIENSQESSSSIPPTPLEPAMTLPPGPVTNDSNIFFKKYHPNRAGSIPGGENLLQALEQDQFAHERRDNAHYPFANLAEWQLVKWFTDASLTQQQIDAFLRLFYVCNLNLYISELIIYFCS